MSGAAAVRLAIQASGLWARDLLAGQLGLTDEEIDQVSADITDAELAERERQARIAAGVEHACPGCGCSDSRACDEGCVWATESLCSRCL